jgi:hypothetical protein
LAETIAGDIVNRIVEMRKVRTAALEEFKAKANSPKSLQYAADMAGLFSRVLAYAQVWGGRLAREMISSTTAVFASA